MRCPACKLTTPDNSDFCTHCGVKFKTCSGCGKKILEFWWPEYSLCQECGTQQEQPDDDEEPVNEECGRCHNDFGCSGACVPGGCPHFVSKFDADHSSEDYEPRIVNVGGDPGGFTICE